MARPRKLPHLHKPDGRPREWTQERIDILTEELEEYLQNVTGYISMDTFLVKQKRLNPKTIEDIKSYCSRFRKTYEKAQSMQKDDLIAGAVEGRYKEGFVKFLLQCNHGFVDKAKLLELEQKDRAIEKGLHPEAQTVVVVEKLPNSNEVPVKNP